MPYVDRQNRICGFLDIEDNETSGKFLRRYFILDTQANCLLWYMDNPQNLAIGAGVVGSLPLTYISKVNVATPKQKPKTPFCFVINALSQRYFLQANDQKDLKDWVDALNQASKITVPKVGSLPLATEVAKSPAISQPLEKKLQVAYKTEIIGGVVVHTPINQNGGDGTDTGVPGHHAILRRSQSYIPTSGCRAPSGPPLLKSGYCVKQGNVRKNWKRRFFALDDFSLSYFKCEQDREPLRTILLKDVLKTHECLVKSGELLMRDNLFEIITSSRTFYIQMKKLSRRFAHRHSDGKRWSNYWGGYIVCFLPFSIELPAAPLWDWQADSPEDMHSWIKEISAAVQALKCHSKEISFSRSISLSRPGSSNFSSVPNFTPSRGRPPGEEKKAPCKAPFIASSWQPWTPVPQADEKLLLGEETPGGSPFMSTRHGEGDATSRVRHRSEPQHPKEKPFMYNLDDEHIRTSDV